MWQKYQEPDSLKVFILPDSRLSFSFVMSNLITICTLFIPNQNDLEVQVQITFCGAKMGVAGLLPLLRSVIDHVNISKYTGKTIGIDACGWIYRGAYACAEQLIAAEETDMYELYLKYTCHVVMRIYRYLNFSIQQISLLHKHQITPIFVFDGAPVPAKADTQAMRNRCCLQLI